MNKSKNSSGDSLGHDDLARVESGQSARKKLRRNRRLGPIQLKRFVESALLDDCQLKREGVHADLMHLIYSEADRPSIPVHGAFVPNPVLMTMLPERSAARLLSRIQSMNRVLTARLFGRGAANPSRRDIIFAESHAQWLQALPIGFGRAFLAVTEKLGAELGRIDSVTKAISKRLLPNPMYPAERFRLFSRN